MAANTDKPDIRTFSTEELAEWLSKQNEKPYRAGQVMEWLWKKHALGFEEMTNLSKELRILLAKHFVINAIAIADSQRSSDGTIKSAFRTADGHAIEGVLIPSRKRMTACISSQVGCSLDCRFCATGRMKRLRNLNADEIFDQVAFIKQQAESEFKTALTNIVYMGMGEPLLNYNNMLSSIEKITSEEGLGMSPSRITVSTAGIAKMIRQLGKDRVKFILALSLHAANDKKRSTIMPINRQSSLAELSKSIQYFYDQTGTRITYEYILFQNFNDNMEDARELAEFCKITPCKVNIIEYNSIANGRFRPAGQNRVDAFARLLGERNIIVNIRRSRGRDIDAACGQLANRPVVKA